MKNEDDLIEAMRERALESLRDPETAAFLELVIAKAPDVPFDDWYRFYVRQAYAITEFAEAMDLEVDTIDKARIVAGFLLEDRRGIGEGPENRPPPEEPKGPLH